MKILRDPHPDTLFRFKQEFRSLATLRHPHLIEFYDLFEYRQLWFFTMELVSGPTFLRHVRSGNQCDLRRLRSALRDLADALQWLHAYKLVHRDIKPDNVLIDGIGTSGVARFRSRRASVRPRGVGNAYRSEHPHIWRPSRARNAAAVDGAADWYAVGVMLYESLTGRLPFTGDHGRDAGSEGSQPNPHHPRRSRLKCPRRGASFACGCWPGSQVPARTRRKCCGGWVRSPRPGHNRQTTSSDAKRCCPECSMPASPRAPGRRRWWNWMARPGTANPAIVQAFADAFRVYPDALVLRGRCYEHESLPFKALDAMMDDLSRQLRHLGSALDTAAPARNCRPGPALSGTGESRMHRQAIERNPVRIADLTVLRRRAFHAFGALLEAISSQRLVVICLDDLHWGDTDSAALFMHLFSAPINSTASYWRQRSAPKSPHGVQEALARTSRPPRLAESRHTFLDDWVPGSGSRPSNSRARCWRVTASPMRNSPPRLAAQSGGNPLFLEQLAADLVRSHRAGEALRPLTLTELIHDRIGRLSSATREFLQFLAAFGEPLPEDLLARLVHDRR